MNKFIAAIVVILLVGAGGLYFLAKNLNQITEAAIERNGSRALGTEVEVGLAQVNPAEGRIRIENLTVANPPGYSDNPIFSFGEITAEADLKQLIVTRIAADRPTVRVETRGTDNNLLALQRSLKQKTAKAGSQPVAPPPGEAARTGTRTNEGQAEDRGLKLRIDLIEITNLQAELYIDGAAEPRTMKVDEIRLTNLQGTRQEIAEQVALQLIAAVISEVVEAALPDQLKGATKKLRKLLE